MVKPNGGTEWNSELFLDGEIPLESFYRTLMEKEFNFLMNDYDQIIELFPCLKYAESL